MKLVDEVYEICENFMKTFNYVRIDYDTLHDVCDTLMTEKPIFPVPSQSDLMKSILMEITAASINYCYWYGTSYIRPGNASSTKMYDLLMQSFIDFHYPELKDYSDVLTTFQKLLCEHRFPMLQERIDHLEQLKDQKTLNYCEDILGYYYYTKKMNLEYFFNRLVEEFPGFSSDIFLKRASLFFLQLYRKHGWFKDELKSLHVPSDYQVPKMLNHYGILRYTDSLTYKINNHKLIQKNSLEECKIRAATILAIKRICEIKDWNVADVDAFFFLNRHEVTNPFHLCITTDY